MIDQNRALIDGPSSGVKRQAINFRHLSLTDFKVKIHNSANPQTVQKAFAAAEIAKKWGETAWAKKLAARLKRATLGDFDRFVVKVNKQKRARVINGEFNKLKKSTKAAVKK